MANFPAFHLVSESFARCCRAIEREGITRPGHEVALGEGRDRGGAREGGRRKGGKRGGKGKGELLWFSLNVSFVVSSERDSSDALYFFT